MVNVAGGDRRLALAVVASAALGAVAFWLWRDVNMYHVVTALIVTILVTSATSLASFPVSMRSHAITVERLVAWLIMLTSMPFVVSRAQRTLLFLAFRDQPPSLADMLSVLTFVTSAIGLLGALLVLPFRRSDRMNHCRVIWVLLAVLDISALAQTVVHA
jgi:hypothetical protein